MSSASFPTRRRHAPDRRHPPRAERRLGRPARPLHDPGNYRPVEQRSHRHAACRRSLTSPAKTAGEHDDNVAATPPNGTRPAPGLSRGYSSVTTSQFNSSRSSCAFLSVTSPWVVTDQKCKKMRWNGHCDVVTFLENRFGVIFSDEDLSPENFATVRSIADFVARKFTA